MDPLHKPKYIDSHKNSEPFPRIDSQSVLDTPNLYQVYVPYPYPSASPVPTTPARSFSNTGMPHGTERPPSAPHTSRSSGSLSYADLSHTPDARGTPMSFTRPISTSPHPPTSQMPTSGVGAMASQAAFDNSMPAASLHAHFAPVTPIFHRVIAAHPYPPASPVPTAPVRSLSYTEVRHGTETPPGTPDARRSSGSFSYADLSRTSYARRTPTSFTHPIPTSHHPPASQIAISGVEAMFSRGIFDDIALPDGINGRQARNWHQLVSVEDRLLVVLRAIDRAGFRSIGALLNALFAEHHSKHQAVFQGVASFLRCREHIPDPQLRPAAIVKAIFDHPKSQVYDNGKAQPPSWSFLPTYAKPPSQRSLTPGSNSSRKGILSTRNSLLQWAITEVLATVDREMETLLRPEHGFTSAKATKLTWDDLLAFDLPAMEEKLATLAPTVFSILTTAGISRRARRRLSADVVRDEEMEAEEDQHVEEDMEVEAEAEDAEHARRADRNVFMGITVIMLICMFFRTRCANVFATITGLILFSCNAHRDVYAFLSQVGLSIGYSTVHSKLGLLALDSAAKITSWGKSASSTGHLTCLILYDNVNKAHQAWRQVLGRQNDIENGTATTLVRLVDVPEGALDTAPVIAAMKAGKRGNITVSDLLFDINWSHIENVGKATVLRVWVKHVPSLSKHRAEVERNFKETYAVHRLPLRKTEYQTLRTTGINEATTTGTGSILRNVIFQQLQIVASWIYTSYVLICGDQLTVDRLRKFKIYSEKGGDPVERGEYILPVIQLFHLKWALLKCIFKLHWWKDGQEKGTFGLHRDAAHIGRGKFNPDKCDFYDGHHIVEDIFEATCIEALRISCEDMTGASRPSNQHLLGVVDSYFGPDGELHDYSYDDILGLAGKVYSCYLTTASHEDSWAFSAKSPQADLKDSAGEAYPDHSISQSAAQSRRRRGAAAAALSEPEHTWCGDRCLANYTLFMRISFWYLELCNSIAEGDIGRALEITKLLRFSFWGAGSTNYGNELLELACNFLREFPPDLLTALKNNWLVNTSGQAGHWIELDLLQEHINYLLKRLFNSKSQSFDSVFLAQKVSINLSGFQELRVRFRQWFGLKKNSGRHADISASADINRLGQIYRLEHVLKFQPGRTQAYTAPDEFAEGIEKLQSGHLQTFLTRTMNGQCIVDAEEDPNADSDSGVQVAPPTALYVIDGEANLDMFDDL
ncbi:hypothetical protein PUNSTDRAFT_133283 [Punctularia strigosozonata HHB-11173 SS5]|uniref:uncharacterized protein n=1 Tax=Punctularia strigosozonata (strain HHB-11173) TaxID=741275 RepID=UPI00044170E3|nr:uncharacterized protein PUNSTDRAFT_133283 [Punctularia strigosozonata HHB-11173 SS5]EIN09490.1 hypothetical protein PUNSTDRAFT_133283 [Punctularia strigosozonata HHB-11173 SS5]